MDKRLKELWERAVKRKAKNIMFPQFTKEEKIRFKREADIIEQTGTTEQILSFIEQADEARKKGRFYAEGEANCSFLLYAAGATKVDPIFVRSPFELFINPLTENKPAYNIVFADKPEFPLEDDGMDYDKFIIKWAVKHGIIKKEQLKTFIRPRKIISLSARCSPNPTEI